MKKLFFYLAIYAILIGCAPSDVIVAERPSTSNALRPVTPTPIPSQTATNVPLRETVTPNPDGQILDGTSWMLDHHIIEGEVRELKKYEVLSLYFRPNTVGTYDSCNHGGYGNQNGRPAYAATDKGEFVFPLDERTVDGEYSILYWTTELYCFVVDEETGEEHAVGIENFRPLFEQLIAYELRNDQLLLYYPEDKRNALVFRFIEPRPTETPWPTETPLPTRTPGPSPTPEPTPVLPTPLPTCSPPVTPTAYPAPVTLCSVTPASYP